MPGYPYASQRIYDATMPGPGEYTFLFAEVALRDGSSAMGQLWAGICARILRRVCTSHHSVKYVLRIAGNTLTSFWAESEPEAESSTIL